MGNYNQGGSFRGGDRDRGGRGSDRGDREMFSAVCADCGKNCEVPFRPSGGKPVYCSNCFKREDAPRGGDNFRSRDEGFRGRSENRSREKDDRGIRQMHSATCSDCGTKCEVPFRPTGDKPIYCSACFNKNNGSNSASKPSSSSSLNSSSRSVPSQSFDSNKKFEEMNAKLDAIVFILQRMNPSIDLEAIIENKSIVNKISLLKAEPEVVTVKKESFLKKAKAKKEEKTKKVTEKKPAEKKPAKKAGKKK